MSRIVLNNRITSLIKLSLGSIFSLILFLLFTVPTYAGFGISPSDILNDHVKPGDHYEKEIVISRSDPYEDLKIIIETELDGMEEWFKFDTGKEFIFPKGETRKSINAIIDVPHDTPFNKFDGNIRIKADSNDGKVAGVTIVKGAKLNVQLVTTGIDVTNLLVRTMSIEDVDDGNPVTLGMLIENVGNVEIGPTKIEIKITDLNNNLIDTIVTTNIGTVPVGETNMVYAEFDSGLDAGEYFGNAKVYLGDNLLMEENLFFRVNEPTIMVDKPQTEVSEQVIVESQYPFITENTIYMLAVIVVITLILLIILIAIRKRKDNESKIRYVIYLVGVIFVLLVLSLLASLFLNNQINTTKTITKSKTIESTEKIMDGEEFREEVKGVSVEYFPTPEAPKSSLVVTSQKPTGEYVIYSEPSTSSTQIYLAYAGEKVPVIDENEDWYQVQLSDGQIGWIEKTSVKNPR